MNVKKFPEPDPDFYLKCRAAAISDFQRGIVFILQATGMHLACLMSLKPNQMNSTGDISWHRTKTSRPMRARVPMADRMTVRAWIGKYGSNKRDDSSVQKTLKKVGARAGFPDLSPMTFRAQRAVRLLDEGTHYHEVAHLMGCSPHVLMANYAQLKEDRKIDESDARRTLALHVDESCDNCGIDACMKRGTEGVKWCDEWTTLVAEPCEDCGCLEVLMQYPKGKFCEDCAVAGGYHDDFEEVD